MKDKKMDKDEKYGSLKKEYPSLYPPNLVFCCGPGWYEILKDLSLSLASIIKKEKWDATEPVVTDVKEKFGTLRVYLDWSTDEMEEAIEKAEELSSSTCEICGEKADIKISKSWVFARCNKCREDLT